jgi:hypothetical protein
MQAAKIICLIVIVVMAYHFATAIAGTGIHQGLGADVFFRGYAANLWQAGIDADLMSGLLLMVSWIFWRERSHVNAVVWILVVLWWGNIIVATYIWHQINKSNSRWDVVLLGQHAANAPAEVREPWPLAVKLLLYAGAAAIAVFVARACAAANFEFFPSMGYSSGIGCFIYVLLRMAYVGRRMKSI